jgi:hypothetical protein
MSKPTKYDPMSQAEQKQYRRILNDPRVEVPWREEALGMVLPCDFMPLCGSVCGVASGSVVLSIIRRESSCPLNRPQGCPFSNTPDS